MKDRELFEAEFVRATWDKPDLTSDEINFVGGADSVTGTGALVLKPKTTSKSVNLYASDNSSGDLDLTATDINAIGDGFSSKVYGNSTGIGQVNVQAQTLSTLLLLWCLQVSSPSSKFPLLRRPPLLFIF